MTRSTFIVSAVLALSCGAPTPSNPDAGSSADVRPVDFVQADAADIRVADVGRDVSAPAPNGAPCARDADCEDGTCRTGAEFPGGFCTNDACDGGCGDGSWCSYSSELGNFCAPLCESQTDCRDGYACRAQGVPLRRLCTPIRGADDGEPCETGEDCQGGTCLPWDGGYCTTNRCESDGDCASLSGADNVCVDDGAGGICLRGCADAADCRDGYRCEDPGLGRTFCLEDPVRPLPDSVFQPGPLDVRCDVPVDAAGRFTITYEIAPETTSYQIVPIARDGSPLVPIGITRPDGRQFNFNAERSFMRANADLLISLSPTVVPPAPRFDEMLAAGANTFVGNTEASEVCFYLVESATPGTVLDLNVYLVGVPGVTAESADSNANFEAVFDEVAQIYGQVGVTLGTIRYFDAPDDHAVLSNERHVADLVSLSQAPGPTFDSLGGVNLFFVREFDLPGAVEGMSTGLPGAVGLHGTHASGLVFTAEYLGGPAVDTFGEPTNGNSYTGLIVAHELGHWLGLHHTTERSGEHDPLDDTGACGNPNLAESCPDWGNLMFPFARAGNGQLTAEQAAVIRSHPALRP